MTFAEFFDKRRTELRLSFEEISNQLSANGYSISKQGVHLWSKNERNPDLSKVDNRKALAIVLRTSESELLEVAGVLNASPIKTREARHIAEIVDRLPEDKRKVIEGMVESVAERL